MPECPYCKQMIEGKRLGAQFSIRPYSVCPFCSHPFTVDDSTKRRQAVALLVVLVALAFTLALCFRGLVWLLPAIGGYTVLALFIYLGNKRVMFVVYEGAEAPNKGA